MGTKKEQKEVQGEESKICAGQSSRGDGQWHCYKADAFVRYKAQCCGKKIEDMGWRDIACLEMPTCSMGLKPLAIILIVIGVSSMALACVGIIHYFRGSRSARSYPGNQLPLNQQP